MKTVEKQQPATAGEISAARCRRCSEQASKNKKDKK